MVRIVIDWNYVSPIFGIASGIVTVDDVENFSTIQNILKFKIKVERGCLGFSSIDEKGVPTKLFDLFKNRISTMARSYHRGILLEDSDFDWYEENEMNWHDLKEEYEKTIEMVIDNTSKPGA